MENILITDMEHTIGQVPIDDVQNTIDELNATTDKKWTAKFNKFIWIVDDTKPKEKLKNNHAWVVAKNRKPATFTLM